jgi:trehalose 6-phosphate phosphatase
MTRFDLGASLARLAVGKPLLAFDFDGTLAPIVPRPEWARVPAALAEVLERLAARFPVAIVTGRKIDDVRHRLGFKPWAIVGCHGAECDTQPTLNQSFARRLDTARQRLLDNAEELTFAGVGVEDKQQSIALHYRRSANHARALALIHRCMEGLGDELRVYPGKCVVNVVCGDAPDKLHAVRRLQQTSGCESVFFAGDDTNDEPVFAAAEAAWVTVRIGGQAPSAAHCVLRHQDDLADTLGGLLASAR